MNTRWAPPSFDSTAVFDACTNFSEIVLYFTQRQKVTHPVPQQQARN